MKFLFLFVIPCIACWIGGMLTMVLIENNRFTEARFIGDPPNVRRIHKCTSISGGDTFNCISDLPIAVYSTGVCAPIRTDVDSTGVSSVNIDGLGARPIVGQIKARSATMICYDGQRFVVQETKP